MFTLPRSITKAAAVAVLLGSSVISASSFAATSDDMAPATDDSSTATTSTTAMSSTSMKADPAEKMKDHVEVRIKTLHDELKITPDQESQWNTVAQTMRDNEQNMSSLIEARHNNTSMSAIDDIKSYQAIAQSHADGLNKFVSAFEPLYNSMSDSQKKTADAFFSKSQHHGHKHMMKKTSTTTTTTTK